MSPDTGGKQVIASSPFYNSDTPYLEKSLHILNAHWIFRISPIKFWYQYIESWLYIIIGIIGSLLITALIQHTQDLGHIRLQLEDIVYKDSLTGLLNRRGLFETLTALMQKDEPFSLCYLDLNKFKFINDTYGHSTGDNVLLFFAQEIQRYLRAVLFHNETTEEEIAKFFEKIHHSLQSATIVNNNGFLISFSTGTACYPRDGKDIDTLINHADKNMYKDKQNSPKRFRGSTRES